MVKIFSHITQKKHQIPCNPHALNQSYHSGISPVLTVGKGSFKFAPHGGLRCHQPVVFTIHGPDDKAGNCFSLLHVHLSFWNPRITAEAFLRSEEPDLQRICGPASPPGRFGKTEWSPECLTCQWEQRYWQAPPAGPCNNTARRPLWQIPK